MIYGDVELYNVAELLPTNDNVGKYLCRIPNKLRVTLNPAAEANALCAAGSEIRFNLEDKTAKVTLSSDMPGIAEVFQGSFHVSWQIVGSQPTEISVRLPDNISFLERVAKEKGLPYDPRLTRIILPIYSPIRLISVEGATTPPRRGQTPMMKYLAYGSSITHGASAMRPTGSYAMRTAQRLGVDLINLGFGGGAHCEGQMADYIAEREDWDFASLEMGINMVGGFSTEEFTQRVEYFVERISKTHPEKWVFAIDLFTFAADFDRNSKKQNEFRQVVKNTVENLALPKLVYVDGRRMLKIASGLTFDLVHPAPAGMEEISTNLARLIKRKMVN
ncbi:MAG: SGNH/GDSL hydrolase family protein [Candidatus Bathyarchaeia archaeon]